MAGFVSTVFYYIVRYCVFEQKDQLAASMRFLPWAFFFTCAVNLFTVFFQGSKFLHMDGINAWEAVLLSVGCGAIIGLIVHFWLATRIRKHAEVLYRRDMDKLANHVDDIKKSGKKTSIVDIRS